MSVATNQPSQRFRRGYLPWLAAYLVMLAVVVTLVFQARSRVLSELNTPEAQAQWQAWRDAEPNQDTGGPVRRRPPSAEEPPALLLMREHFAVVLSGSVLFSSLLFAALALAARGVFAANASSQESRTPRA